MKFKFNNEDVELQSHIKSYIINFFKKKSMNNTDKFELKAAIKHFILDQTKD